VPSTRVLVIFGSTLFPWTSFQEDLCSCKLLLVVVLPVPFSAAGHSPLVLFFFDVALAFDECSALESVSSRLL
jgi:hypothetical protein